MMPAMAPLAPIVGLCDAGSLKMCASAAMTPHSR